MITGGITSVNLATPAFGSDLQKLGRLINLKNLDDFGSPLALVRQLYSLTGSVPALFVAFIAAGISQEVVLNITNPTASFTDTVQRQMYNAMTQITGANLAQILAVFGVTTVGIETMADLLNPLKLFPNSYQSLTAQMTTFQNQMEKFATDNLPAYANILAKNAAETMALFKEALVAAADFAGYVKKKIAEGEGKSAEHEKQEKLRKEYNDSTKDGTFMQKYYGIGLTDEQKKKKEAYEKSIAGNDTSGVEAAMQQYAVGGITRRPAIFGESGPEAAVPLPDGRSIPVTFDTEFLKKTSTDGNDQIMKDLVDGLKQLSASLSANSSGINNPMDAIAKHLEEMKNTAKEQLDIHSTMAELLGEQKDISSSILNNSY